MRGYCIGPGTFIAVLTVPDVTLLFFWPVEDLAELTGGPTGSGQVARGACLFALYFSLTRSTVLIRRREESRPNMTLD